MHTGLKTMLISKETVTEIEKFCIVLFTGYPKDEYDPEKHRSHLVRDKPNDIQEGGKGVFLYGKYHSFYHRALSLLGNEQAIEYLRKRELEEELWHLTCELILQRDSFKNIGDVKSRVHEFLEGIAKPLVDYEILVPLSSIDVGDKTITIDDSLLRKFNSDALKEWGILEEKCPPNTYGRFLEKSCLVIQERGNNGHLACNRARDKARYLVKLLQVALSSSRVLTEMELLFSIGSEVAIRDAGDPGSAGFDWKRGFIPIHRNIDDLLEKSIVTFLEKVNPIVSGEYGPDLQKAFRNAIVWMGRALEEEDADLRIIYLSSALESILSTRADGRKGEAIACRMLLLNSFVEDSFVHPSRILYIYELRSKVIHGSELSTATKDDYLTMRLVARETIENASLAIQKMGVDKKSKFHKSLKETEIYTEVIEWLEGWSDPRTENILNYMINQLE